MQRPQKKESDSQACKEEREDKGNKRKRNERNECGKSTQHFIGAST